MNIKRIRYVNSSILLPAADEIFHLLKHDKILISFHR